jgi:uncharacterized protein
MPVYLTPGVYVEEVPGTPPITPLGTSTAGFIGVVNEGVAGFEMPLLPGSDTDRYTLAPVSQAELVTSFDQFKNKFGDFHEANSTLAHAVYGFFNNGGTRCWVIRVNDLGSIGDVNAALDEFARIDEIAIVAAPGANTKAIQDAVIDHCENLKYRFAIIDGQRADEAVPNDILQDGGGDAVKNSQYAALYFPWLRVADPITEGQIFVPPSGHMAGLYARVDGTRGVHKAPANEVIRGALGLEYLTTKNEQAGLNPIGINVIRGFNGDIRVWGARTLGGDANGEFKYISTRRLMNMIGASLEEGTRFAVFEPNAHPLWQRITRAATAFLTIIWRDGALFGTTPEQAFYVRCDETTNPPEVRELGQVIIEIGMAVVKPAEFVIFRISQLAGPASE